MTEAAAVPHRWDPLIKIIHWGMVSAIIVNALIVEEGSVVHIWVGYVVGGLLAIRLVWGVIGPRNARFTAFPPNPKRAISHIRGILAGRAEQHRSHNPLGALMVYAIWSCLALIVATGIAMAGPPPGLDGSLPANEALFAEEYEAGEYGHDEDDHDGYGHEDDEHEDDEGEEVIEEVHETAVNLLYLLIGLHILGVIFESVRTRGDTVRAMLPSRR